MARKKSKLSQSQPLIEELDSRTLFSADVEGLLVTDFSKSTNSLAITDSLSPQTDSVSTPVSDTHELVIIDTNTPDYKTLIDDLIANTKKGHVIEFVLLDSNQDGIEQISETLSKHQGLGAVHIISHGSDGNVQLGNSQLDNNNLSSYFETIATWATAFSETGDLLFYGCNLAATESGQSLINDIANLTGADVAASDDLTGSAALGGDWELEYNSGQIEANTLMTDSSTSEWQGLLADQVLESFETSFSNLTDFDNEVKSGVGWGQSFIYDSPDATYDVSQIDLVVYKEPGADAGQTITVTLRDAFNGTILGSSATVSSDDLATSEAWGSFDIGSATLSDNVQYVIQIESDGGGKVYLGAYSSIDIYTNGDLLDKDGNPQVLEDAPFRVIGPINNTAPVITSNGGGATANLNVAENTTAVTTVTATDADLDTITYSISSGADAALFSIDANSGVLTFIAAPNFEAPADADTDNVYEVTVKSADGNGGEDTQAISVTVTNVLELVVTTTNATGTGSLHEAILDANANTGVTDTITFNIGSGAQTILVDAAGLPTITDSIILDATTQPGYSGTPLITLDGSATGASINGIRLNTDDSTVKGFIVHSFGDEGIEIDGSTGFGDNNIIQNNWVGIDAAGAANPNGGDGIMITVGASGNQVGGSGANEGNVVAGNSGNGIIIRNAGSDSNTVEGNIIGLAADGVTQVANGINGIFISDTASNNTIGGTTAGTRNVISGNTDDGIRIDDGDSNLIQGNYIGTNVAGTAAIGNGDDGVSLMPNATNNTVGGTTAAERNIISGNDAAGVYLEGSGNFIQGNYIGTDVTGTLDVGNGKVKLEGNIRSFNSGSNTIGGTAAGAGNLIAFGGAQGIELQGTTTGMSILGNSIFSNTGIGIDLNDDGVTANDAGDVDTGVNNLQNFPVLSTAETTGTQITITGSLNSTSNSFYRIEFFASTSGDASGNGEGETYLGFANVATDGAGNATINAVLAASVAVGDVISATATKSDVTYTAFTDTSEFAANIVAVIDNDAPVLASANNLTTINEDEFSNAGTLVSDLIAGQVSDADAGSVEGIAVIGVDDTNGSWQYTTNGGSNWFAFGVVDAASARLLTDDVSTFVRFVPDANWNGTVTNGITFHAWDQTSGTAGGTADLNSTYTVRDEFTTAAYTNNDGSVNWVGDWIESDSGGATGGFIEITGQQLSIVTESNGVDIYREVDLSTATTASLTFGGNNTLFGSGNVELEVSGDGGTSWTTLETYTSGNTGVLAETFDISAYLAIDTQIRFTVTAKEGSATITFDDLQIEYTSGGGVGGTTAFSVATASSNIIVTAVNDAPTATNLNQTIGYTEDDPSVAITDIVVSDVDTGETITATLTLANPTYGSLTTSGTATYVAGTGIWTITDTLANVNTALAAVDFIPTTNNDLNTSINTHIEDASATGPIDGSIALNVTAVNDAPLATNLNQTIGYTEGDPSVAITNIVLSDVDSSETITATLTLANPTYGALTISGTATYTAGTGIWTITDTLTNVNTALAAVAFVPTTNNDLNTSITTHIEDAAAAGPVDGSIALNVTAVNDAPEVDLNGVAAGIDYTTTFIEGGSAINIIDTGVSLIDIDNSSLSSIVVNLTNRLDPPSKEALSANTGATGLSAVWSSATDTLTISGAGTVADYLSVLSTVQYDNTSSNPDLTTRIVTFVASDGTDNSVLATTTITLSAVNDEPVTDPASASGAEDATSITITLSGSDVDGTVQSFALSNLPANGILYTDAGLSSTASTGSDYAATGESLTLYFAPTAQWNGATTFQFAAKDDLGLVDATPATATITVSAVNDAPVATVPGAQSVTEFVPYTFSTGNSNALSISDIDAGSNAVQVTLTATNGILTLFGSTATLTFSTGDGTNDSVMTFTGTQSDINTALDGMTFISTTNHGGAGSLQLDVNDLNNTGSGSALSDSKSIAITINTVSGGTLTGDEFLQGDYIEVGISSDGAIGSNNTAPAGFVHSGQQLGVISDRDKDGWATYDGDHVLAGTFEEGWGLRIGGTNYNNNNIIAEQIAGSLSGFTDTGTEQSTLWSGGVAGVNVQTTHLVEKGGQFLEFQVTLTNTTGSALTDVYYMRNADPDNNFNQAGPDGFITINSIISQGNDGSGIARVEAGQSDGSYFGLVGFGDNARVTHGGFSNRNPVDVFDGTGGLNATGTVTADQSISLAFKFDTIAAGETVNLRYQYIVADPIDPGVDLDLDGSSGAAGPDFVTTFTEGGSSVNIADSDAIVFDPDSANLTSMTVALTSNPDGAQEILAANTSGTSIALVYNSATGTLTLSNSDTLANYQQVLRTITYNNTSLSPDTTDRTVEITVNDGTNTSSIATSVISIVSNNDAPVATVPGAQTVNEDIDLVFSSGNGNQISIADSDAGSNNVQVVLTIANGITALNGTSGLTITSGADGSNTVTFTGTVTNINAALDGLTFTPTAHYNGSASIQIVVNDLGNTGIGGAKTDTESISITVDPINDQLTATNLTQTIGYTEGDLSVALNDIVVSDVDTGEIITATLTLANPAYGVLTTSGTASYAAGTGVWSITDTVANVNAALATISFIPATENELNTSIGIAIADGNEDGATAVNGSIALNVTAVNDAPLATNLTQTIGYTEGVPSVTLADIVVTDVDTVETITATLTVADPTYGALTISGTATYSAGTGIWTITDTLSNVNAALASVAFIPTTNNDLDTSITTHIEDAAGTGPVDGSITLNVTAVNDAPLASNLNQTIAYTEGDLSVAIADIVVSDLDTGEVITATLTLADPTYGVLTTSGTAAYTAGTGLWTITDSVANVNAALAAVSFTPATNNDLDTSITTHIEDASATGPVDGSIALNVTAVNDAPTATNLTQTIGYTEGDLSVALNDIVVSDVDTGETITATLTLADPTYGALTISGTATYTAGTGIWTITDTVTNVNAALASIVFIPLTDNDLNTSITTHIEDAAGTGPIDGSIALNVTPVNDAPLATNLNQTIAYTEGDLSVALNDIVVSDVDTGETITATLTLTNPTYGALTTSGAATYITGTGIWTITDSITNVNTALAAVAFVPAANNDLNTSITTHIEDASATGPADGSIALNVTAVNDAPLATNLNQTIAYTEGALSVAIADIVVSDLDTGETITTSLTLADPAYGSLTISGTATYTAGTGVWTITDSVANVNAALAAVAFAPATDNDLNTSITTHIEDAAATGPVDGSIVLNVTPVNDAPLATNLNQTLTYAEDDLSVALFNIVVSDVDTGETITATLTLANPAYGTLTTSGTAIYTAGAGIWTITDTVTNVNTALATVAFVPVTNNDLNTSITTHIEDASATGPADGSIALNVTAVNDAPTGTDNTLTLNEDTPYTLTASDFGFSDPIEGHNFLGVRITTLASAGTLTLNGAAVNAGDVVSVNAINLSLLVFTPALDANGIAYASFTFQVQDDGGNANGGVDVDPLPNTLVFNVTPVNDTPIAIDDNYVVDEDASLAVATINGLLINDSDVDPDNLTVITTPVSGPANGLLTLNTDGAFTYTPNADFNGTDSFVYQMTDNNGAFATAQVNIIVNPTNDDPIITLPGSVSTNPGDPIIFSSTNAITVSDIDGPGEDFQITFDVSSATVTLSSTVGLTFIEGDGDTDSRVVFTGKINDINTALDGLTLTPASGFYGQTSLIMTTVNLNDPGSPPAQFINTVNITVNAPPVVTNPTGPVIDPIPPVTTPDPVPDNEDEGPGVVLIIDEIIDPTGSHGEITPDPEVEPDVEPEPVLPEEPPIEEAPPTIPEKVAEVIETVEAIPGEILATVMNKIDGDNGIGSLTDHTVMWRSIDVMLHDIDQAFSEEEHRNNMMAYGMKGMTFSLSAGFVAWALRGGSLLATALTTIPIWRGLDPLPVLAMSGQDRRKESKLQKQERENEDDMQAEIGKLIDGATLDKDD